MRLLPGIFYAHKEGTSDMDKAIRLLQEALRQMNYPQTKERRQKLRADITQALSIIWDINDKQKT